MEHNAYNHHLDFNREQTVGIVAYLFFDVKQPSPSLFLSDPAAYTAQVQHAGMRAALAYLRYGGYPALYTLTCARASWGKRMIRMYCYYLHVFRQVYSHYITAAHETSAYPRTSLQNQYQSVFHSHRSVCHKPNYVFISLAQVLCYAAAHPMLKKVWKATFSISSLLPDASAPEYIPKFGL